MKFLFAITSFDFESTRRYYLLSVKIVLRVSTCYLYFTRRDGIYDNKGDNILQFSKTKRLISNLNRIYVDYFFSRVYTFSHYYGIYNKKKNL